MSRGLLMIVGLAAGVGLYGQSTVFVDVNLNMKHSVDTFSQFDRKKYINIHASLTDKGWDSDAMRDQFLDGYDVYLGRDNGRLPWQMEQLDQDPGRQGWPSPIDMTNRGNTEKNRYATLPGAHRHEDRSDMMIGGQTPMYPNGEPSNPCCGNAVPWIWEGHEALAEYFAQFLVKYYGSGTSSGEPRPTFVEVMNEPFVQASEIPATRGAISELHNAVARRVHELAPDVMVGGYTSAHPEHNAGDFALWDNAWKLFIDIAGANMDFFSVHLYDNSYDGYGNLKYRAGANAEAVLDMIEHYSHLTLGEVKPFNISEYGNFTREMNGTPYTKERDWPNLRSFSSMLMQFLEKPDKMVKVMPFVLLKATWWTHESGNRYPHRVLRQQFELEGETGNAWVYTELVKFFHLWSDVNGTRIDTRATDPDYQVDAYVDGKKVYVILNSLEQKNKDIKLKLFDNHINPVETVRIKHLRLDGGLPVLDSVTHAGIVSEVTLGREATMILEYTFENVVTIDQNSSEEKHYADKYLQPIEAEVPNIFVVDSVERGANGEAILRLGIGRDHGRSLRPVVVINGDTVEVPRDFRGYDQLTRDGFFGVLEIPVPYELLADSNTVAVTFKDGGGHISSLAMQTWEMSTGLTRSERQSAFAAKFTILDKTSGMAVEGAEVFFAGDTLITNASGEVLFDSVGEGIHRVGVGADGYEPYTHGAFEHYDYTESEILLDPRSYQLEFHVIEKDLGLPVYNASVTLDQWSLNTNAEGKTGLGLYAGAYGFEVSNSYFGSVSGEIQIGKDTLVQVLLPRLLADVKFRIYSDSGAQRVRDAEVEIGDTVIVSNTLGLATFRALEVDTDHNFTIRKQGFSHHTDLFSMKQDTTIVVDLVRNTAVFQGAINPVRCYPNPVIDRLIIDAGPGSEPVTIRISDLSGSEMKAMDLDGSDHKVSIDLSYLPSGFYLVKIGMEGNQFRKSIVKL